MTDSRKKNTGTAGKSKQGREQSASSVPQQSMADQQSTAQQSTGDQQQRVRERAYEIYLARNGAPGDPLGDWLVAERECMAEEPRQASQRASQGESQRETPGEPQRSSREGSGRSSRQSSGQSSHQSSREQQEGSRSSARS